MAPLAAGRRQWLPPWPRWRCGPRRGRQARARRGFPAPLDLFSVRPPKLRGSLHRVAIPLPRPRPAEAPNGRTDKASTEKPSTDKAAPDEAGKAAEPAKPSPPPAGWR